MPHLLEDILARIHDFEALEVPAVVDGVAVGVEPVLEERLERAQHQGLAETPRPREHADIITAFEQIRDKPRFVDIVHPFFPECLEALAHRFKGNPLFFLAHARPPFCSTTSAAPIVVISP